MSISPWLHLSFSRSVVFVQFAGAAVRKEYRLEGLHNRNVFLTALEGRSQNQSVNRGGFFWGWSGKTCSRTFSLACRWLSYPLSIHIIFSVYLCSNFPFYKDTNHTELGPMLDDFILTWLPLWRPWASPVGLSGKESASNAREAGSIPGLERSLGGGNGNSF